MATIKLNGSDSLSPSDYSNSHIDIKSPVRTVIAPKGGTMVITTPFEVEMGEDEIGLLQQQHKLGSKYLLSLASTAVKSGHRGVLTLTVINHGDVPAEIYNGEPVAQLLILKAGRLEVS